MKNPQAARAAAMVGLGVALGAFGTHALRSRLSADDLRIWETGVLYHQTQSIAAFAVSLSVHRRFSDALLLGTAIFAGTLYVLVGTGTRWMGAITPVGGAILIGTWIALALKFAKGQRPPSGDVPS